MDADNFSRGSDSPPPAPALATPALADPAPDVEWRLTSSFVSDARSDLRRRGDASARRSPTSPTAISRSRFRPPARSRPRSRRSTPSPTGKAECAHTALSYYWSKDPSFIFASSTPFGMNARQHAAWLAEGGGGELIDEFLADRKVFALPAGNTGGQMAGWFRKEIRGPQDFAGLKMRIGGFAGKVFQTLGAEPVVLPKDAIYGALESGTLDAFEWVGPYDDEKFGERKDGPKQAISKVAPNYYYPGWWKGGMQLHLVVAKDKFDALPKAYQAALRAAAGDRQRLGAAANTTPPIPAR